MDTDALNKKFIEATKNKIGKGENIANIISDVLPLGKEAIYRRLRGDVVFTFSEIVTLSKHLGISIDNVAGSVFNENVLFELKSISFCDVGVKDYYMLEQLLSLVKLIAADPNSKLLYSSNMFTPFTFVTHKNLSKLITYKTLCQTKERSQIIPFRDWQDPPRLDNLRKEIIYAFRSISDISYILDSIIFQSLVNDIKYLYNAHFITAEDVQHLKDDLFVFLTGLEYIAVMGVSQMTKKKASIYVSNTNFQATYCHMSGNTLSAGLISTFGPTFLMSTEEQAVERMRVWIQSLKKVSTLISESGEIQRKEFFDKQREIINKL